MISTDAVSAVATPTANQKRTMEHGCSKRCDVALYLHTNSRSLRH